MAKVFNKEGLNPLWILETALTWLVVFALLVYGFGKIIQFQNIDTANKLVGELTGMELMWSFYAYSQTYVWILGAMEIFGGILLFFRRTRIWGCLFATTIFINVILQDIFYEVNLGALHACLIYQSCLVVILCLNRRQLIAGLKALLVKSKPHKKSIEHLSKWVFAFVLFAILRYLEYLVTH
jgi:hypothetical protein